jgi:hypothetical protein
MRLWLFTRTDSHFDCQGGRPSRSPTIKMNTLYQSLSHAKDILGHGSLYVLLQVRCVSCEPDRKGSKETWLPRRSWPEMEVALPGKRFGPVAIRLGGSRVVSNG